MHTKANKTGATVKEIAKHLIIECGWGLGKSARLNSTARNTKPEGE